MGCHALLQETFPTQGSNLHLLCLLHRQVDSLPPDSVPTHKQAAFHTLIFLLSFQDLTFYCVLCSLMPFLIPTPPLAVSLPSSLKVPSWSLSPLRLPWLPFSWFCCSLQVDDSSAFISSLLSHLQCQLVPESSSTVES